MMSFLTTTTVPVASAPQRRLFGLGWLAAAGLALAVPLSAQAGSGYLSVNLNLRAGPSIDYPVVRLAPRGTAVYVYGCVDDYGWCDVSWGGNRGWVSGEYLDYDYYDRRVPVIDYGPRLGLGLISFSFGNYWNSHYRHQSWYGQRNHYSRVVVRHGSSRHNGYYSPRRSAANNRYDRDDRYDRHNRYQRNDARRDHRRDGRVDARHDRQDARRDVRSNVRNDLREIRRDVRNDNRQVRNDRREARSDVRTQNRQVRSDRKQATRVNRNDNRQASNSSSKRSNDRNSRNTERQR